MGRLMALDLGRKRCGVAVTDVLRLVANGLAVVATCELEKFLAEYLGREPVDLIIIGKPVTLAGEPSESWRYIRPVVNRLRKLYPTLPIEFCDERFTSTLAHRAMLEGGMKKSHRREKGNADIMAATIMLNDYLENRKNTQ